jgi:hypothetical protein
VCCRQLQDDLLLRIDVLYQFPAVEHKKRLQRCVSDTLVAIDERVVANE